VTEAEYRVQQVLAAALPKSLSVPAISQRARLTRAETARALQHYVDRGLVVPTPGQRRWGLEPGWPAGRRAAMRQPNALGQPRPPVRVR
jgi:DNA-binding IclR family transcriptional regulator